MVLLQKSIPMAPTLGLQKQTETKTLTHGESLALAVAAQSSQAEFSGHPILEKHLSSQVARQTSLSQSSIPMAPTHGQQRQEEVGVIVVKKLPA